MKKSMSLTSSTTTSTKMENIVKSKVKCPKCGNKNTLTLSEIWKGHTVSWNVIGGKFDRDDGNLEVGDPYKVQAQCKCGHHWTIKKALQIDDIIE